MSIFTMRALTMPPGGAKADETGDRAPPVGWLRRIAGEPLVHFCLLGGLIFAADAWLRPPVNDTHTIVVTSALRKSFIESFSEDKDREPTPDELRKMQDSWVASEILYREGRAAGVDRGDTTIRDRIAYKLQLLIFDQIKVDNPTPDQLKSWFVENHARFDEPERVGFYLTPATDEATARQRLLAITTQQDDSDLQRQTRAILARPVAAVAASFGEPFLKALLATKLNEWSVLQSKEGWHVARLDSIHPEKPARLEDMVDDVTRIWHDDQVRHRAWEAVTRLKANYTVRIEP